MGIFHQAGIGCINPIHICINLAQIRMQGSGNSHRAGIRSPAAQSRQVIIPVHALEACHNYNIVLPKLIVQPFIIDPADTGIAMGGIG